MQDPGTHFETPFNLTGKSSENRLEKGRYFQLGEPSVCQHPSQVQPIRLGNISWEKIKRKVICSSFNEGILSCCDLTEATIFPNLVLDQ